MPRKNKIKPDGTIQDRQKNIVHFSRLYAKMDIWLKWENLMRQIQSPNIAQLLMQMHFVPVAKRHRQLAEAEKLLAIVEKNKEYPYEFVCYRITGYLPKTSTIKEVIKGDLLAEDLRLFISKLSGQIAEPIVNLKEKIYTIEQLAAELSVTTKTINRWRKKGLVAKKFVFEAGQKKLGITQSALDKFMEANPKLSKKTQRFKRLTADEKRQIIKIASKLAKKAGLSLYQIIEQTAKLTGRSHETIRYTLLKYQQAHPDRIIGRGRGIIGTDQAAEIYKQFKEGEKVKRLIEKSGRSKSTLYRLIKMKRARTLLGQKVEYIFSDEFTQDKAEEKILAEKLDYKGYSLPEISEKNISEYAKHLQDTPTLNRQSELNLFRRYNFLKYLVNTRRAGIRPAGISGRQLDSIEHYLREAQLIKKMIIEANLRFVIAIARKHNRDQTMLMDLISEGIFSLMRAIEKFDYTKGFRFSTYATWVIAKDFARKTPESAASGRTAQVETIQDNVDQNRRIAEAVDSGLIEQARQSLTQVIRDNLDEREQYVILNHFGLIGSRIKKEKKTLQQIGEELSLTKERVRQIELTALQKLRQLLSMEEFELLTE
jgi:RNA polymerase sigma factor (sigma-70 family)